jgi:DNA repair and recombination protein RAD54B
VGYPKEAQSSLCEGASFKVGEKDIEIDRAVSRADFLSGASFGRASYMAAEPSGPARQSALTKQFVPLKPTVLNTAHLPHPAASSRSGRQIVPLEPVDLIAIGNDSKEKSNLGKLRGRESCWTANWWIELSSVWEALTIIPGENHKAKNTRHGMEMLSYHIMAIK